MGQESTGVFVASDCLKEVKVLNSVIRISVSTKCICMTAVYIMHRHLCKIFNSVEPKIQEAVFLLEVSPSPGCSTQRRN